MKKRILALVLGIAIVCGIAGIAMAAWDDTKSTGDTLTADEWNAMVADQKSRLPKDGSEAMTGTLTAQSITPDGDNTRNLGASDKRWSNIYAVNAYFDNYNLEASDIPNLDASKITSGTLGLARIPNTLTGKDADTVDGIEGASIFLKDGSRAMTGDLNMDSHNITNTGTINTETIDSPTAYVFLKEQGDTYLTLWEDFIWSHKQFIPSADNTQSLGRSDTRWADIYAVNTHWGDLGFTETSYNGKPFKVGDTLVLKVKRFDNETGDTMCIPIPINETPEYKALEQRVEMLEERLDALESNMLVGTVTVSGTVKGINQEPIGGAIVVINSYSTTTDENGNYSINVTKGIYNVTASATGYRTETKTDVSITADTRVDFVGDKGLLKDPCSDTTYSSQVVNKWKRGEINDTNKVMAQIYICLSGDS